MYVCGKLTGYTTNAVVGDLLGVFDGLEVNGELEGVFEGIFEGFDVVGVLEGVFDGFFEGFEVMVSWKVSWKELMLSESYLDFSSFGVAGYLVGFGVTGDLKVLTPLVISTETNNKFKLFAELTNYYK